MNNTLEFEVTQNDIDAGIRMNSNYCPISLAVNRTFRYNVNTAYDEIRFVKDCEVYKIIPTNRKLKSIIHQYDLGKGMKPFRAKFKLNKNNKWIITIAQS